MSRNLRLLAFATLTPTAGCGLIFGPPMSEDDFVAADKHCDLRGAALIEGSYIKGTPSIIYAPKTTKPADWDSKLTCVAKVFGGDGMSKSTRVNFEMRFDTKAPQ